LKTSQKSIFQKIKLSKNLKNDNFILKRNIKMEMNLYNLPKDMLVKMVTEIQRETKDEYEKKLKEIEKKLSMAIDAGNIYFIYCEEKDCKNYCARGDDYSDNFFCCKICNNYLCEEHNFICENCDKFYCKMCYDSHLLICQECGETVCGRSDHIISCETCEQYYCFNKNPKSSFCSDLCEEYEE